MENLSGAKTRRKKGARLSCFGAVSESQSKPIQAAEL